MQPTPTIPTRDPRNPDETLIIRMAGPADAPALRHLAQLDSAPPPESVPTLVAEVGGEMRAALSLDGGPAIANPFERTADLVAMLAGWGRSRRRRRARRHDVGGRSALRAWLPLPESRDPSHAKARG
jgi:hypothetical protein